MLTKTYSELRRIEHAWKHFKCHYFAVLRISIPDFHGSEHVFNGFKLKKIDEKTRSHLNTLCNLEFGFNKSDTKSEFLTLLSEANYLLEMLDLTDTSDHNFHNTKNRFPEEGNQFIMVVKMVYRDWATRDARAYGREVFEIKMADFENLISQTGGADDRRTRKISLFEKVQLNTVKHLKTLSNAVQHHVVGTIKAEVLALKRYCGEKHNKKFEEYRDNPPLSNRKHAIAIGVMFLLLTTLVVAIGLQILCWATGFSNFTGKGLFISGLLLDIFGSYFVLKTFINLKRNEEIAMSLPESMSLSIKDSAGNIKKTIDSQLRRKISATQQILIIRGFMFIAVGFLFQIVGYLIPTGHILNHWKTFVFLIYILLTISLFYQIWQIKADESFIAISLFFLFIIAVAIYALLTFLPCSFNNIPN